jgi:hypothetical protein
VSGYVIDDLVLITGLADPRQERHRRELSRLVHGAIEGGPALDVPACCLVAAALTRPALADHLADLIAAAPPGAINVSGLTRGDHLDALRTFHPDLNWSTAHAAVRALTTGLPVLTTEPDRYTQLGVDVLAL